jgi:hypothetical protein
MTQFVIANNVNTQLAAAAASGVTTLTLASSTNLPTLSAGQIMPLTLNDAATGQNYEIVYVTAISGVTLTVERAQEGTGDLNWSIGDYAFCAPTAGTVAVTTGSSSNTFQVANATAANMAPNLGQVQALQGSVAGTTTESTSATLTNAVANNVVKWTGATGTLTNPLWSAMTAGQAIRFVNDGTGVLTVSRQGSSDVINIPGTTATSIALQIGDDLTLSVNATANNWDAITGSALRQYEPLVIAPATASQHALQAGQALGLYLGTQVFTASGTYTPGTYTVGGRSVTASRARVRMIGAGGAGGGCVATGSGACSVALGGGAGAYAEFSITSGLTAASITIGAAGTAVSGETGNTGGNTIFGSICTCAGGTGGLGGGTFGPTAGPNIFNTQSGAAAPTISGTGVTPILAAPGWFSKNPAAILSASSCYSSAGADSPYGVGGGGQGNGVGGGASGYGAGGGGSANTASLAARSGGVGANGLIIVDEFA